MSRARRGLAAALLTAAALSAACTYFPTVLDTGGVRIQPQNGRAVRQATGAEVYLDLTSMGKYGDTITGVHSPVAGRAELIGPGGALRTLEVPGESVLRFAPGGYRVVLSDLKRPLQTGETFIVTLLFEKSGGLGVITVVE